MSSVLLAVGDPALRVAACGCLEHAGHCVLSIERALALLKAQVSWDLAVIDDSQLGRDVLTVLAGAASESLPAIGLGVVDQRLRGNLALPLDQARLTAMLGSLLERTVEPLTLRRERRMAVANGREVSLTPSESRLLSALLASRPREVSVAAAMEAVWGASRGAGRPTPLRAHVRNLRMKLAQIGLGDAVRSQRGRGYQLEF